MAVGYVTVNGTAVLQCAALHLTAFMGVRLSGGLQYGINVVDPIGDAGTLVVSGACECLRVCSFLAVV